MEADPEAAAETARAAKATGVALILTAATRTSPGATSAIVATRASQTESGVATVTDVVVEIASAAAVAVSGEAATGQGEAAAASTGATGVEDLGEEEEVVEEGEFER